MRVTLTTMLYKDLEDHNFFMFGLTVMTSLLTVFRRFKIALDGTSIFYLTVTIIIANNVINAIFIG